ncbi:MAG TPA: hypothetical protein PKC86_00480 [Candidatus Saccharibacteria bacterium]|nr:hypothetical protein [Candidatus Saccharibacteria bacterium]
MITYSHIKHTNTITQSVAHLYEHLFVESFYVYATEKLNIDPSIIGYIGGETFENVVFMEAWFYDDRIARLFQRFIKHEKLNFKFFDLVISQVSSEDRVEWNILNKKSLKTQLATISDIKWNPVEDLGVFEYSEKAIKKISPIEIKPNAPKYKSLLITAYVSVKDLSLNERALFLRLSTIVQDVVGSDIRALGFYEQSSHPPQELGEYLVCKVGVTGLRVGVSNETLQNIIEKHLQSFDWKKNKSYIKSHFSEYSKQPLWNAHPRDHLKHVSVIAGNKTVKLLATQKNILSIFNKIQIRVETVSYQDVIYIK